MRCNRCYRPMKGTTAYDGACECGGLIEAGEPATKIKIDKPESHEYTAMEAGGSQ